MNDEELLKRYLAALDGIDISVLNRNCANFNHDLAGLFVPSVPAGYHSATNKIMIVGRETRAWNVPQENGPLTDLSTYLKAAMSVHKKFFQAQIAGRNTKGKAFHNFVRAVAKQSGGAGIVYSNLFCFSWKKSMPKFKSALFKEIIAPYSKALLETQIDYFRPDIIIFANGVTSASVRRQFFPVDVCSKFHHYEGAEQGSISRKKLWEFVLHDRIRCFRINHPSSLRKDDELARQFLLTLLPSASGASHQLSIG